MRLNFGSDMMSIFCGEFKLDDMWDIIGNICERAHGNLLACVRCICEGYYMENIWVIYIWEYLCGFRIMCGLMWVFCEWANKIKA